MHPRGVPVGDGRVSYGDRMEEIGKLPMPAPFMVRSPVDPSMYQGTGLRPAGDTLGDALQHVLDGCVRGSLAHAAQLYARAERGGVEASPALMFVISPGTVHVVGLSELARAVRAQLTDGTIAGWALHPLPATRTPLHALHEALLPQQYNILIRNGFSTIEEVAAVPPGSWSELRHVGPKFVDALRNALDALAAAAPARAGALELAHSGPAGEVGERAALLAGQLPEASRLRYRDLLDGLAASRIPTAALAKIAAALAAEPAPPPDDGIVLLLDTAGEPALLDYYRRTHPTTDPT